MPIVLGVIEESDTCAPWTTVGALACCDSDLDLELMVQAASDLYDNLSGGRYCSRVKTIRPNVCLSTCACAPIDYVSDPWGWSGAMWACGCGTRQVDFGDGIRDVTEVIVGGEVLPSTAYTVRGGTFLVRIDGGSWPCCSPIDAVDDEVFQVSATFGAPVSAIGVLAANEMACELAKASTNDADCRLPARVQNMTRQQVSFSMIDPSAFLQDGFVGLPIGDMFLASLDAAPTRRGGRAVRLGPKGRRHLSV